MGIAYGFGNPANRIPTDLHADQALSFSTIASNSTNPSRFTAHFLSHLSHYVPHLASQSTHSTARRKPIRSIDFHHCDRDERAFWSRNQIQLDRFSYYSCYYLCDFICTSQVQDKLRCTARLRSLLSQQLVDYIRYSCQLSCPTSIRKRLSRNHLRLFSSL